MRIQSIAQNISEKDTGAYSVNDSASDLFEKYILLYSQIFFSVLRKL